MKSLLKIRNTIASANKEELTQIIRMVKERKDYLDNLERQSFKKGDLVKWKGSDEKSHKGKILRFTSKNVTVMEEAKAGHIQTKWTIHHSFLSKRN